MLILNGHLARAIAKFEHEFCDKWRLLSEYVVSFLHFQILLMNGL